MIIFPDVRQWALDYLATRVPDGVEVSSKQRTARAVTVRDDGGQSLDRFRRAHLLGLNVWDEDEKAATDLALLVDALLVASPDGRPVIAARHVSGPIDVPDDSEQPHRYLVVEVTVRGAEA